MARRTKIVATIGPASDSPPVLQRMVEAGMDVARLGLEPRQEGWTGAGFGGPREVPSGQVWVVERGEERCEAAWIDGWLLLSAFRT